METFTANNSHKCTNETQAIKGINKFVNLKNLDFQLFNQCSQPCRKISYKLTMNTYHTNSLVDPGNYIQFESLTGKGVIISLSFLNNFVEERNETLIYDFPNFLAAGK
jgi:hypothetical protein